MNPLVLTLEPFFVSSVEDETFDMVAKSLKYDLTIVSRNSEEISRASSA